LLSNFTLSSQEPSSLDRTCVSVTKTRDEQREEKRGGTNGERGKRMQQNEEEEAEEENARYPFLILWD